MSTQDDYLAALNSLVPGDLPPTDTDRIAAIDMAMTEHSRHRPRVLTETFDGGGERIYQLSESLASWDDGWSEVLGVEYPAGDVPGENALDPEDWGVHRLGADGSRWLVFVHETPGTDEEIRVSYTVRHSCSISASTVHEGDEPWVLALAASHYCRILAAAYSSGQGSTIAADSVDHASKRRDYEAMADAYRKQYADALGVRDGPAPAAAIMDQDVPGPGRGLFPWLTHPGRYR